MNKIINNENELIEAKSCFAQSARAKLDDSLFNFGKNERLKMVFDLEMHVAFLGESIRCGVPKLFYEYAVWTNHLLTTSGGDAEQFKMCLRAINAQIQESGVGLWVGVAQAYLAEAENQVDTAQPLIKSHLSDDNPHKAVAESFLKTCLELRRSEALEVIHDAVASGVSINEIYLDVITPVMYELGRLWHLNRITVGHEHYCTAVAQMVMAQLFSSIFDGSSKHGKLVFACVAGELHEIGARMLSDLFEMNGWDTVFLGADVPTQSVIDTLIQHSAGILAISVTLGSNLGAVSDFITAVRATPACVDVKIMVGGAPFKVDSTLWQHLGADGWAPDAPAALLLAEQWRPR